MTVLLAAAFRDHAMIAADGVQTEIDNDGFTRIVDKTRAISNKIVATKFGYSGPQTEVLWEGLCSMSGNDRLSIQTVLRKTLSLGVPIYEERRDYFAAHGQGDYGLTMFFASYDDEKGPGIHWIDFKMGRGIPTSVYYRENSSARWVAQGPEGVKEIAGSTLRTHGYISSRSGPIVDGVAWTRAFVVAAQSVSEQKIGFPAALRSVGLSDADHFVIEEHPSNLSAPFSV